MRVKDSTELSAALEHSTARTARRFPGNIYSNIFLPEKIYEALPAAYIAFGALFIFGTVYIGIGHSAMTGYLTVGLSCVFAGVTVGVLRRRERSKPENAAA